MSQANVGQDLVGQALLGLLWTLKGPLMGRSLMDQALTGPPGP